MPSPLVFAAVLGVKDEVELIGGCIAHLRALGVDRIRVLDSGSTDGTLECIRGELAGPDLTLTHHSDQDPDAAAWQRTAARLGRESGADWVMYLDADEFWIPANGSLRATAGLDSHDLITVDRFNVPLDRGGLRTSDRGLPASPDVELIVQAPANPRRRIEANELPWIRIVPVSKLMARADRIGDIIDGFHDIIPTPGPPLRRAHARDLLVAHVPYTSLDRFRIKLDNIRRMFAVHDAYCGIDIAWHWRRQLSLTDADSIRREFELQIFDDSTLVALREAGSVCTAAEWFAERAAIPAQPSAG